MSRWIDFADALAAHLRSTVAACASTLPDDERVDVIVFRDHDVGRRLDAEVAKLRGLAVLIAWNGGPNPDRKANTLKMGAKFSLSIWARPVMEEEGGLTADDLAEDVFAAAHGFVVASGPNDATRRLEIVNCEMIPNDSFLIYEASAEVLRI